MEQCDDEGGDYDSIAQLKYSDRDREMLGIKGCTGFIGVNDSDDDSEEAPAGGFTSGSPFAGSSRSVTEDNETMEMMHDPSDNQQVFHEHSAEAGIKETLESYIPFTPSAFSSSTVFKNCLAKVEELEYELMEQKDLCNIHESTIIGEIERELDDITTTLKKLQKRNILILGTNGIGKSFLLNLLFLMSCVDPRTYACNEMERGAFHRNRMKVRDAVLRTKEDSDLPKSIKEGEESDCAVLHVLEYSQRTSDETLLGLEALLGHTGPLSVVRVNPIKRWESEGEEGSSFAKKFVKNPQHDQEYLLKRYEGYCEDLQLKEKYKEKDFPVFLLPSQQDFKASTFFTCKNSFGCTFHLCVRFFSEDEILGHAQDWIRVVALSIRQGNPRLKDKSEYITLKHRFSILFPDLKQAVLDESDADKLPSRQHLKGALHSEAQRLAKQGMHVFAGKGDDFHRDRLFVMRTFAEEIGVGTKETQGLQPLDPATWKRWVKRWMLKEISCFLPSRILASGCSIVDSPGTDDLGCFPRSVIRTALQEHDVVVGLCKRNMAASASTVEAIFDQLSNMPTNGPFSFPSRVLQDSSGKSLVLLHYWEVEDKEFGESRTLLSGKLGTWAESERNKNQMSLCQIQESFEGQFRRMKNKNPNISMGYEDIDSIVQKCTTSFSALPVLYSSLILNAKFRAHQTQKFQDEEGLTREQSEHKLQQIVDCTGGHTFFALPEILEQKHCRRKFEDFLRALENLKEKKDEDKAVSFGPLTTQKIVEVYNLHTERSAKSAKGQNVLHLLDNMVTSSEKLETNLKLRIGRRVDVLWKQIWWDAKITKIFVETGEQNAVEISYLDDQHNITEPEVIPVSKNAKNMLASDRIKSIDEQGKSFSIDTALTRFERTKQKDDGIIKRTIDEYFCDFLADENLDPLVQEVQESLMASFKEIEDTVCEHDDRAFDEQVLAIFSESRNFGKSIKLNLESEILAAVLYPLSLTYNSPKPNEIENKFIFLKDMLSELRELIMEYSDFIGAILKTQIFSILLPDRAQGEDHSTMEGVYAKYKEVGSRSLQKKMENVFSLSTDFKDSKYPDFEFFSRSFKGAVHEQVKCCLVEINSLRPAQMKIDHFKAQIKPILEKSFAAVRDEMISIFLTKIKELKSEFVGSRLFCNRFTYRFLFDFVKKLYATISRSNDDRNFKATVNRWYAGVQATLRGLPREEDIGSDISSNMIFLKVQQDIHSQIEPEVLERLCLSAEDSAWKSMERVVLDPRFCEESQSIAYKWGSVSLHSFEAEELKTEFNTMGYQLLTDPDRRDHSLWRALATQFCVSCEAGDSEVLRVASQIRLQVADQILCWCNERNRRSRFKALTSMSSDDFAKRLASGESFSPEILSNAADELCLHFFLLRFCRPRTVDKKIVETAINIWMPGNVKAPAFQYLHPHANISGCPNDAIFMSEKIATNAINIVVQSSKVTSASGITSVQFEYSGVKLPEKKNSPQSKNLSGTDDDAVPAGHQPHWQSVDPDEAPETVVSSADSRKRPRPSSDLWLQSFEAHSSDFSDTHTIVEPIQSGLPVDVSPDQTTQHINVSVTGLPADVVSTTSGNRIAIPKANPEAIRRETKRPDNARSINEPKAMQECLIGAMALITSDHDKASTAFISPSLRVGANTVGGGSCVSKSEQPSMPTRQSIPDDRASNFRLHLEKSCDSCLDRGIMQLKRSNGSQARFLVFVMNFDMLYILQEESRRGRSIFQRFAEISELRNAPVILIVPYIVFEEIQRWADYFSLPNGSLTPSQRTKAKLCLNLLESFEGPFRTKGAEKNVSLMLQDLTNYSRTGPVTKRDLVDCTLKCAGALKENHRKLDVIVATNDPRAIVLYNQDAEASKRYDLIRTFDQGTIQDRIQRFRSRVANDH